MVDSIPFYVPALFLFTFACTVFMFFLANGRSVKLLVAVIAWSVFQSALAYASFYENTEAFPPRLTLVLVPAIAFIVWGLLPKQLNTVLENRNIAISTFLHTIRIPVEICLYFLFVNHLIPELMTFEGRNFDIISGLTAPVIGLLFIKGVLNKKLMIAWNVVCLGLVLFILGNGVLSAELPFQQFAFDQPNRAVLIFPYILLPAVIVPVVIYTHITDIIKLRKETK